MSEPSSKPPSFDPRTWTEAPDTSARAKPRRLRRLSWVVIVPFAVAILLLGVGIAWMFHPRAASVRPAVTIASAAHPKAAIAAPAGQVRVFHGEMDRQSFYTSTVAAGIDDRLVSQITGALAFDFDFVREIHPGDVFDVAVESNGGAAAPALIYVSLVTAEKTKALYRFRGAWYDAQGLSTQRSLMRTPVEGARVTSTFGMRDHPVLGYTRMHKGVDFGVPVGTPIYASGDGTVDAIGLHSGYGFYLRIAHTKTLATAYGHLSAYPPGIKIGSVVHQGEVVAFSGNTGLSTGPHLHYEILVNGEQVNPLEYKLESASALHGEAMAAFAKVRERVDAARASAM